MKPVVLIILDGWGLAPPGPANAISLAQVSYLHKYWNSYPHTELAASGEAVGLPTGEDGNTETGHMNMGAGRVVFQDLPRINMAIADGSFYRNEAMIASVKHATNHNSNVHIMGILSDSGVHGSREHLYAILELIKHQGYGKPVYLHLFTDGRDSPPQSGVRFMREVEDHCAHIGLGTIATVLGRYYAMDRDYRWERTQQAYSALTQLNSTIMPSAKQTIENAYKRNITDEFIEPTIIANDKGIPYPRITSNDAVIFYNYRIDRPRQLTRAFILPNFETDVRPQSFDPYAIKYYHKHTIADVAGSTPFTRSITLQNVFFVTMTEYERNTPAVVAFPPEHIKLPIGRVISDTGSRQLHMAETEKERFVSYYFNGLREEPFPGEDRIFVPSPRVATYDLKPEMSTVELTNTLIDRMSLQIYSFFIVNYASPDMVAHTGNIPASVKACEIVDSNVGRLVTTVLSMDGACIVTADHGNVEEMLGPNGEIDTEHSINHVPFIMISNDYQGYSQKLPSGKLADIAPTILTYMGIPIPTEMTGRNLLEGVSRKT